MAWETKPIRATGDPFWPFVCARITYRWRKISSPLIGPIRAARRPCEVICTLTAGTFLGWAAAIYATPAAHRVAFWNPFSVTLLVLAGLSLVVWVLGEAQKAPPLPPVINHTHHHYYTPASEPLQRGTTTTVEGGPPLGEPPDELGGAR